MINHSANTAFVNTAVAVPTNGSASSRLASSMCLHTMILSALLALGVANAYGQAVEEEMPTAPQSTEEAPVELPPLPKEEDLQSFYVSPTSTQTFLIDLPSIAIGKDGVIRYTLVSRSRTGAINISHEGIRCQTGERKAFAFGRSGGDWVRSRRDEWRPLSDAAANRQYAALANEYFCQGRTIRGDRDEIAARIRSGQSGRPFGS